MPGPDIVIDGRCFRADGGPYLMGVINVTPDSFSDGGLHLEPARAAERAVELVSQGADLLDIGGESTRPGSEPVGADEEMARVIPAIRAIRQRTDVPLSIDTTKSAVAREAVAEGASMVNDVSMLRFDPELAPAIARLGVPCVLMHSRKRPRDMQEGDIVYHDVVRDIQAELREAMAHAVSAGIRTESIILDPGLGFSKTPAHNLTLIGSLGEFRSLGRPILVGPSRKFFIGAVTGAPVESRSGGTAASVAVAVMEGADFLRVHDVFMMRQAAMVARAIAQAREAKALG